jgi:hypothetical protein
MKMPKQRRAVERKVNRLATRPAGANVRPSDLPVGNPWLDQMLGIGLAF